MLDAYAHMAHMKETARSRVGEGQSVGRLVGARIRRMRRAAGMNLDALAKEAKVHRDTISKIENGKVARPQARTVGKIARALGAEAGELSRPPAHSTQGSPIARLLEAAGSLAEEDVEALARVARTIPATGGFIADEGGKMEPVRYRIDLASRYEALAAAGLRAARALLEDPAGDAGPAARLRIGAEVVPARAHAPRHTSALSRPSAGRCARRSPPCAQRRLARPLHAALGVSDAIAPEAPPQPASVRPLRSYAKECAAQEPPGASRCGEET